MSGIDTVIKILCIGGESNSKDSGNSPVDCCCCVSKYKTGGYKLTKFRNKEIKYLYKEYVENLNVYDVPSSTFTEFKQEINKNICNYICSLEVKRSNNLFLWICKSCTYDEIKYKNKLIEHIQEVINQYIDIDEEYKKFIDDLIYAANNKFSYTIKDLVYLPDDKHNLVIEKNDEQDNLINLIKEKNDDERNKFINLTRLIFINPIEIYDKFCDMLLINNVNKEGRISDSNIKDIIYNDVIDCKFEIINISIYNKIKKQYIINLINAIDTESSNYIHAITTQKINSIRTPYACCLVSMLIIATLFISMLTIFGSPKN